MSGPELVRLDDEAARMLVEMADGLPGNPDFKGVTSEALKDYYENTYLPMIGEDTVNAQ